MIVSSMRADLAAVAPVLIGEYGRLMDRAQWKMVQAFQGKPWKLAPAVAAVQSARATRLRLESLGFHPRSVLSPPPAPVKRRRRR